MTASFFYKGHFVDNKKHNMTETLEQEQVVMTPKGKTANSTTLMVERRSVKQANGNMHVAGGEHKGIVINKEVAIGK